MAILHGGNLRMRQSSAGVRKTSGLGIKTLLVAGLSLIGAAFGSHAATAAAKHSTRHVSHVASRHSVVVSHHAMASRHAVVSHHEHAVSRQHVASYYGYKHHVDSGYRIESVAYRTHHRYAGASYRHSVLQCVPYAREVSHIDLTGNAYLWWAEAAGRYARGDTPAEGAVLNFRGIGRMPLGHVAVVTDVIDSRTILVTQANWVAGTITNDVRMQDVSPNNDWSEVQVQLGDSRTWGAAYPTYGFIYNHPAASTVIAANGQSTEVAEAPAAQAVSTEAPDRNLQ
jgi:surface antigen